MKKLFALSSIIFALTACSQEPTNPHHNQALETAIQECHKAHQGHEAVHNCLAQRGFEMPKNHPPMHHHSNPELAKAMKECHQGLTSKDDMAKFEACLKAKGFEKPTNHSKTH
ncbi:hypothetical protein V5G99_01005 [Bibersteinia trehalosi]|uniref:Lipoprotein n=1 Tax=Bibersteinia trehalosi TaxID=47735 RepID=A0A3R8MGV4_BIBTR|nr:hypothetical protein [Bibersteinia trehalosi]RRN03430.1 hypothetical protein EIM44_07120 [Bibersteinia trehalosi]